MQRSGLAFHSQRAAARVLGGAQDSFAPQCQTQLGALRVLTVE